MNKILLWYRKLKDVAGHGKTGAFLRGFLFVNISVFLGLWLGLKFFLPEDFILAKINERLFVKDMGLVAEEVDISLLGNISIYEGTLTEKGEKTASFYEFTFRPSLIDLITGDISGTVYLEDINNQGGMIEVSFETGDTPCYYMELNEAPLSVLKPVLKDISLVGQVSGEAEICQNEKKTYDGNIEINGTDIVFRGKVPTNMGPLNVGKIDLGAIAFKSDVKKSTLSIGRFLADGLFSIDIAGKVTLNSKKFDASRLNLDVRIRVPDAKKVEENPTLNLAIGQMSQYKKETDKYAFLLKGRLFKPSMMKAPDNRVMKTESVKNDKTGKTSEDKVKRKPRKRPNQKAIHKTKRPENKTRKKPEINEKKNLPKRKDSLMERNSTTKLEDDVDEKKDDEKKEKIEKEEPEETASEEVEDDREEVEKEEEKEKKEEPVSGEKKEEKSSEEDEEDKEE